MYNRRITWTGSWAVLALIAAAPLGCEREPAATPAPASTPTAAAAAAEDEAVTAILAKADLVDGTADRTVKKCAACQLGMDGQPGHAIKTNGYKMLFCSGNCKETFEQDTRKAILALNIPEE